MVDKNLQMVIPSVEVTTTHSIIIKRPYTWMTTRYGLRRNTGREKTWLSKTYGSSSAKHADEHYFSLGDLPDDDTVSKFLDFLDIMKADYTVILP